MALPANIGLHGYQGMTSVIKIARFMSATGDGHCEFALWPPYCVYGHSIVVILERVSLSSAFLKIYCLKIWGLISWELEPVESNTYITKYVYVFDQSTLQLFSH